MSSPNDPTPSQLSDAFHAGWQACYSLYTPAVSEPMRLIALAGIGAICKQAEGLSGENDRMIAIWREWLLHYGTLTDQSPSAADTVKAVMAEIETSYISSPSKQQEQEIAQASVVTTPAFSSEPVQETSVYNFQPLQNQFHSVYEGHHTYSSVSDTQSSSSYE